MVVVICGVAFLVGLLMRSKVNINVSVNIQNPNMNFTYGDGNKSSVVTEQCNKAENNEKLKSCQSQVKNSLQKKRV